MDTAALVIEWAKAALVAALEVWVWVYVVVCAIEWLQAPNEE